VAIDRLQDVFRLARDLGLQEHLLARQCLHRASHPFEGLVGLGTVEPGDALIEGVAHQAVEALAAKIVLHLTAVTAGAHAEAAEADAGVAQSDLIGRRPRSRGERRRGGEGCRTGRGQSALQELTAIDVQAGGVRGLHGRFLSGNGASHNPPGAKDRTSRCSTATRNVFRSRNFGNGVAVRSSTHSGT
jgi:hypothetical protein